MKQLCFRFSQKSINQSKIKSEKNIKCHLFDRNTGVETAADRAARRTEERTWRTKKHRSQGSFVLKNSVLHAPPGARTLDTLIKSQVLYQLS